MSMLLWAAGFPAAETLLDSWSPFALNAIRFLLASTALLTIWALMEGVGPILRARWGRAAVVGGLGFGLGAYLMLVAQQISDPVTVVIVATTLPLVAAMLEVLLDGRRLKTNFWVGVGATVVGGFIAAGANPQMATVGLGALIAFAATALFTWGSRAAVVDFPDLSPIGRTTLTIAGALIVIGPVFAIGYALGLAELPVARFDHLQAQNLAVYAVGAMALSQLFWIWGVGRLGVGIAALHVNLTPFYVMIFLFLMGTSWSWMQAAGAMIVAFGVIIAQLDRR